MGLDQSVNLDEYEFTTVTRTPPAWSIEFQDVDFDICSCHTFGCVQVSTHN